MEKEFFYLKLIETLINFYSVLSSSCFCIKSVTFCEWIRMHSLCELMRSWWKAISSSRCWCSSSLNCLNCSARTRWKNPSSLEVLRTTWSTLNPTGLLNALLMTALSLNTPSLNKVIDLVKFAIFFSYIWETFWLGCIQGDRPGCMQEDSGLLFHFTHHFHW